MLVFSFPAKIIALFANNKIFVVGMIEVLLVKTRKTVWSRQESYQFCSLIFFSEDKLLKINA